jgi:hypothetical protein
MLIIGAHFSSLSKSSEAQAFIGKGSRKLA